MKNETVKVLVQIFNIPQKNGSIISIVYGSFVYIFLFTNYLHSMYKSIICSNLFWNVSNFT